MSEDGVKDENSGILRSYIPDLGPGVRGGFGPVDLFRERPHPESSNSGSHYRLGSGSLSEKSVTYDQTCMFMTETGGSKR